MKGKYPHTLSPISVGNVVLKNRFLCSTSMPHFLQGPEKYPSENVIRYLANIARNGAAVVTFSDWSDDLRHVPAGDICRFPSYDFNDVALDNYMVKLADAVHCYDSKLIVAVVAREPIGYGVNEIPGPVGGPPEADMPMGGMFGALPQDGEDPRFPERTRNPQSLAIELPPMPCRQMGREQMQQCIDQLIRRLRRYRSFGFDGISLHMSYGMSGAQFLSPRTNHRTDEFGGSLENRSRYPLMICQAVKDAFGPDFLVEVSISGDEGPGGWTTEDSVGFSKLAEGKIDLLQIRERNGDLSHPTGFNSTPVPSTLRVAAAIKAGGANIVTVPIGGFQDPELIEQAIASGQTDMVGAARAFICDYDYGKKLLEGRGEDVVPCIRCNRCHGIHCDGPWISGCSVNPRLGVDDILQSLTEPPARRKYVAVVGGGIAGMYAAITCAQRGHAVTLYEAGDYLGGQLLHAEYASFKWPLKRFRDYLVRQLERQRVTVQLQTKATPELLEEKGFDVIVAALGAEPNLPDIPGLRTAAGEKLPEILYAAEVFGREAELGKRVAVIGGSEIGTEAGLYLAQAGHAVTVLTRQTMLAYSAYRVHYYDPFRTAWEHTPGFCGVTEAAVQSVDSQGVNYTGPDGTVHRLEADSVVISGGMNARKQESLAFYGAADEFYMIGDCSGTGDVRKCIREAYCAALRI